jgi:glucarate dehydratase
MKITDIRSRLVAIPIQAPTRHSYASPTHYIRNIVELFTDEGITGLGETYSLVSPLAFEGLKPFLIGEDPFNLEKIRIQISQRGYFTRQPLLLAPVEFACYDLQGKKLGLPVYALLGGKVRDRVPMSAYLFYRYPNSEGEGEVTTPKEMVRFCRDLVKRYGFKTLKLKAGVFDPEHEFETLVALRRAFGPGYRLRIDPNAIWSPATAIRMGMKLLPCDLEYYEDPTWGISGLARVREKVPIPIATNMSVIEFEHLGPAVESKAIDCILSDPWYWGGLYYTKVLDMTAKHLGLAVSMHSGVEFGLGLSIMLHVAVTMPNLVHAIDSHYHHLTGDIIKGAMLPYDQGSMAPSDLPGFGVELDEEKMNRYEHEYKTLAQSDYGYPPDPKRPQWYAKVPNW